jgi:hypothetical protein
MKKLFVLFACVALFAACNSGATETTCTSTEEVSSTVDASTETTSTETVEVSTATVEATATK